MARKFVAKFQAVDVIDRLMDREYRKGRKAGRREGASYRRTVERSAAFCENAIESALDCLDNDDPNGALAALDRFRPDYAPYCPPEQLKTWWLK
jgi:hypothetical protein